MIWVTIMECQIRHRQRRISTCGWCGTSSRSPSTGISAGPPPSSASPSRRSAGRSAAWNSNSARACSTAPRMAPSSPRRERCSSPAPRRCCAPPPRPPPRPTPHPSRITIAYTSGLDITPAVRELRSQHPDAEVHALHLPWNEPREALLGHRADAVVTRLPLRTEGLHVTILYDDPRVLIVPRSHRLAGKQSVTLADIADEPIPRLPDAAWHACWGIDPRPYGTPAPDGPLVNAVEDKVELSAAGQAVATVSAGLRAASLHPDLTTVPLDGVEQSHVVLATRADERNRLVAAFRRCAQERLTGPAPAPAADATADAAPA